MMPVAETNDFSAIAVPWNDSMLQYLLLLLVERDKQASINIGEKQQE